MISASTQWVIAGFTPKPWAKKKCQKILDKEEMVLPTLGSKNQINPACAECLEACFLRANYLSEVIRKTIRKDFASGDLIVGPKSIRKQAMRNRRDPESDGQVYKGLNERGIMARSKVYLSPGELRILRSAGINHLTKR